MSDVAGRVLRTAAEHADDLAVVGPAGTMSYRELADRVGRLAEQFNALAAPGSLIAVEASSRLTGLLAVLAAGVSRRTLLPLDLSYPQVRREAVLRDARPGLLLRENEELELVPAELPAQLVPRTGLDGLAYVVYTSGSTGTPKGIAVSHQTLADRIAGLARRPGLVAGESMLALAPLSFDPSLAELLLPLLVGGTVIAADPAARTDPDLFVSTVDEHRPDVVQATPSFWRLVTAVGWSGLPHGRIWTGGEALTRPLAELLLPKVKELWNVYGPSETTIWSTAQLITDPAAIGLGDPVPGTGLFLDPDPATEPGPEVEGEILLYGVGVAEGYLGREDLTAKSFVDHLVPGGLQRCYRTGDRARRRADGILEFIGRVDQQVKIRGHRVELGDVEAAFEAHPAVREAVVVLLPGREDQDLPAELAVRVVADGNSVTPRMLRNWVAERLPRALIPARIGIAAELPRTPSGKADRTALQADLISLAHSGPCATGASAGVGR